MDIEKKHKEQVNVLNRLENELMILIGKTENQDLMNKFLEWQEQRIVCNSVYNEWLAETLITMSGGK